ncbi:kinase-like protein [Polyplosphaeria fusca]|uniref:Kinase-like protein n=1 Tax=Polyplosphaeria fusca TaxID=682080 RepID=A0A9P4RB88_9PLEO|nr:kinase-like protein [Polyplosphaeria fusca]
MAPKAPPYKSAEAYFNNTVRQHVVNARLRWTAPQITDTMLTMFYDARMDAHRTPFDNAVATKATVMPTIPTIIDTLIPPNPTSKKAGSTAKAAWKMRVAAGPVAAGRLAAGPGDAAIGKRKAPAASGREKPQIKRPKQRHEEVMFVDDDGAEEDEAVAIIPEPSSPLEIGSNVEVAKRPVVAEQDRVTNAPPAGSLYPMGFWPPLPWDDTDNLAWATKMDFIKTAPNFPQDAMKARAAEESKQEWVGQKFLGAGSYGSAGLWVRVDRKGNIAERIAIKDATPTPSQWRDILQWWKELPREIAIHQLIDSDEGDSTNPNLLHHYGHRIMMRNQRYRIYLEYCALGNIYRPLRKDSKDQKGKILYGHFRKWQNWHETRAQAKQKQGPDAIPEGFIWYVAQSLVNACLLLQQGKTPGEDSDAPPGEKRKGKKKSGDNLAPKDGSKVWGPADGKWKPITHLDIQLTNIFLDTPDPSDPSADSWPRIVLADFGQAFFQRQFSTDPALEDNPRDYSHMGYEPRYAPEQSYFVQEKYHTQYPRKLNEKTDVWLIGAVLWSLITNRYFDQGPVHEDPHMGDKKKVRKAGDMMSICHPKPQVSYPILSGDELVRTGGYPEELADLIRRCLEWDQEGRPSLEKMRGEIQTFLDANPDIRDDRPELAMFDFDEDTVTVGKRRVVEPDPQD